MNAPLTPLATELAAVIRTNPGKRVPAELLARAAIQHAPELVGHPDWPHRFRAAINELHAFGTIALPATGSRTGWDRRTHPPLPQWVIRTTAPQTTVEPAPRRVWPHALEAAGRLDPRGHELEVLDRVAQWLRNTPEPFPVPVQERSLELFDDEKALDGLLKTRLFTTGALSLTLLACFTPALPVVSRHVPGQGPTRVLVAENLATYSSLLADLQNQLRAKRPDLHIAWGAGNAFARSVHSLRQLDPVPVSALYFGDLDVAGAQIATTAAAEAKHHESAEPRPAVPFYRFLLNGPASWRVPDRSNRLQATDFSALLQWFTSDIRQDVADLFANGVRIPQERMGLAALRHNPELWLQLIDHDDHGP